MRDIIVSIKHRPQQDNPVWENQLAWTVDTNRYELIIGEPEVTLDNVIRGIKKIIDKEKSRQHGNADSSKCE